MKMTLLLLTFLSVSAEAATNPEAEKITKAFVGNWVGEMTAVTPYGPPETIEYKMDCRAIASGSGVSCDSYGSSPSVGELTQTCLIAFDPGSKSIHYMCVSNMGEVHDHKGNWEGNRIQYEPYSGYVGGQLTNEFIRTDFLDSDSLEHSSEIRNADGSVMNFLFRAKRKKL